MINGSFWKGKKVFLTGHTGFKGGWTSLWLKKMGATVKGFSLQPSSKPSFFEEAKIADGMDSTIGDIRDLNLLKKSIIDFHPEIVIHMAAQPLVLDSYTDPIYTYQTNIMGSINLFEAVRECNSVRVLVNVTTDKCYENNHSIWSYRENDSMGGFDPYSSSKACSEIITAAYRRSFFNKQSDVSLASVRAGNVIGGGDWAKDRLIPDVLRAFDIGKPAIIRNPQAIRPWQHVLEPISGYLILCEKLYKSGNKYAESWNFGPDESDTKSVRELLDQLVNLWPTDVKWLQDKTVHAHEEKILKLDISKAKALLKYHPRWDLSKTLQKITEWHLSWLNSLDIEQVSINQIKDFETTK